MSSGKRWDTDTVNVIFSFLPGIGNGAIKGDFTINIKSKEYRVALLANNFDLNIIEQYLKDLTSYGSFSANIDADIKSNGNLNNVEDVTTRGILAINDFHFGKNPNDDYVSFDKLVLAIREISPKKKIFSYDSILLSHPYFKYERYDKLDNLQTIFGKNGANITAIKSDPSKFNLVLEIANYIQELSADVRVRNIFDPAHVGRIGRARHEFRPPVDALRRKCGAEAARHALACRFFELALLAELQAGGHHFVGARPQRSRSILRY